MDSVSNEQVRAVAEDSAPEDREPETAPVRYYLYVGSGGLSPSSVCFEVPIEEAACAICTLLLAEFGESNGVEFHVQPLDRASVTQEILLCEALDELLLYDDPDPGIYDPSPPKDLLLRAQFFRRAQRWYELYQERMRDAKSAGSKVGAQDEASANGRADSTSVDGGATDSFNLDDIPEMSPEDRRNSGLILLLLLAQAYYKILEETISMASWLTLLDLNLNQSYLWTVQNLTNLLKNHEDLQDFPDSFEPVLPDLFPATISDLEWEDMIAPEVEGFLASVQKYVVTKGCYEPAEGSAAWVLVEMIRGSVTRAIECAENHNKRLRAYRSKMLSPPAAKPQETDNPAKPGADSAIRFPTPDGASWSDVTIRFIDGETVSIKVCGQTGRFVYPEMGMANSSSKKCTVQWELLRTFAANSGILTWGKPGANRKNQKRKETLAKNLKAFFQLEGEPIVLTDDKKGWRTVFSISGT